MSANLWKFATQNAFNTTLNGNVGVGDTTITLNTVTGLQFPGTLVLDRVDANNNATPTLREYISYTGISTNTLTGCARGLGGSTAQTHTSGAKVEEVMDITHWNDLLSALANLLTSAGILDVTKVVDLTTAQALSNKTLTAPVLSGTVTGTYTLGGTPTITKPVLNATNPTAQTYTPSAAGTATLDLSLANQHYITMPAGNITIALSNDTSNQPFVISITQDSGGSRTVTWFTTIKWAGGSAPTLTTTANKRDTFGFIRTGSGTYDGFVIGQNL